MLFLTCLFFRFQKLLQQKLKKLHSEVTLEPLEDFSAVNTDENHEKLRQAEEKLINQQNLNSNRDGIAMM